MPPFPGTLPDGADLVLATMVPFEVLVPFLVVCVAPMVFAVAGIVVARLPADEIAHPLD